MSKKKPRKGTTESSLYPGRNFHHLINKINGGENSKDNLLLLKVKRHFYWHRLFGSKSLEEVIELLFRVHRAKGRCFSEKVGLPCRLITCPDVRAKTNGHSPGATNGHQSKFRKGAKASRGNPHDKQASGKVQSGTQRGKNVGKRSS